MKTFRQFLAWLMEEPEPVAIHQGVIVEDAGLAIRAPVAVESPIRVKLEREERPRFRRIYTAHIAGGFKVEINLRTAYGSRMDTSCLTQSNGKWILFDAKSVADKIIDRELYPRVQEVVDQILALDRAYLASNPSEFTDEGGGQWRRIA